jgi:hypothetical protein
LSRGDQRGDAAAESDIACDSFIDNLVAMQQRVSLEAISQTLPAA